MDTNDKLFILETLAEAICLSDKQEEYGLGDKLFEAINLLKSEWGMDEED